LVWVASWLPRIKDRMKVGRCMQGVCRLIWHGSMYVTPLPPTPECGNRHYELTSLRAYAEQRGLRARAVQILITCSCTELVRRALRTWGLPATKQCEMFGIHRDRGIGCGRYSTKHSLRHFGRGSPAPDSSLNGS
jgi:hypothetical protein